MNSRIFITRSKNDKCKPFGSLYDGEYISYLSTRDSVSDMAQTNDVVCSDSDDNGNGGKILPLIGGCSFFLEDTNNNSSLSTMGDTTRYQKRNCNPFDGDRIILVVDVVGEKNPYDNDDILARSKKPRTIIGSRIDNTIEEGSIVIVACPSSTFMIPISSLLLCNIVVDVSIMGRNIISCIESKSDD
jgi:hypothetical protein